MVDRVSELTGQNMKKLILKSNPIELWRFENMQFSVFTTEIALYFDFKERYGIEPDLIAGHSVGEYAGLVCAGYLTLENAVKILKKRAELVNSVIRKHIGHMTVVENTNRYIIDNILASFDSVYLSLENSPNQFAISGKEDEIDQVEELLTEKGAKKSPLFSSPPIHSPLMTEVQNNFKKFLKNISFTNGEIPFISNVTGKLLQSTDMLSDVMSNQLVKTVKWRSEMQYMDLKKFDLILEISGKRLLSVIDESNFLLDERMLHMCYGVNQERKLLETELQLNGYESPSNLQGYVRMLFATLPNKSGFNQVCEIPEIHSATDITSGRILKTIEMQKVISAEDKSHIQTKLVEYLQYKE